MKHRIVTIRMVVVSLVVGVVLAVASVPYGTLVREAGYRWGWVGGVLSRLPGEQRATGVVRTANWFPVGPEHPTFTTLSKAWLFEDSIGAYPIFEPMQPGTLPQTAEAAALDSTAWLDVYWAGFPFDAAVGWRELNDYHGLVRWSTTPGFGYGRTVNIPLRPIWPGLLANTVFYGAIMFGVLVGLRWLRTRRRRARGRCVACAYEFGDGVRVCPECGLAKEEGNGQ